MSAVETPRVVPLLVLGSARRRQLQQRLTGIVKAWHQVWAAKGAADPVVTVTDESGSREHHGATAMVLARRQGVAVACAIAGTDAARSLLGTGAGDGTVATAIAPADGMALAVAEGVLRSLCTDVLMAGSREIHPELESRRASHVNWPEGPLPDAGVVLAVSLGKGRPALELALTAEWVDALLGPRPVVVSTEKMISRRQASSDERVRINAVLGMTCISWRDLAALAPGQVIMLDQTLDAACALVVGRDGRIGEAQLGAVNGTLAVQISHVTPAATTSRTT